MRCCEGNVTEIYEFGDDCIEKMIGPLRKQVEKVVYAATDKQTWANVAAAASALRSAIEAPAFELPTYGGFAFGGSELSAAPVRRRFAI